MAEFIIIIIVCKLNLSPFQTETALQRYMVIWISVESGKTSVFFAFQKYRDIFQDILAFSEMFRKY